MLLHVILAQPESLSLPVLARHSRRESASVLACHSERSEESPHLFLLLPVILAQPESLSFSVLLFVIPAGNLLLFWLVILSAAKNPRICFCCCPSF